VSAAKTISSAMVEIVQAAGKIAEKAWNSAKAAVKAAAEKAAKWTKDAIAAASKWAAEAANSLKKAVSAAWNAAKAFAAKAAAALKSAWEAAKKAVTSALNAVAEWAKKLATAVLRALCKGLQWTLDKVVAAAVTTLAKAAVAAVCIAGKMVAAVMNAIGGLMDNLFRMERISYAGSLSQAVKGNFGKLEFDIYIFNKKYELRITLDLAKLWKSIMDNIVSVAVNKITGLLGKKSPSPPPATKPPVDTWTPAGYGGMGPPPVKVFYKPK